MTESGPEQDVATIKAVLGAYARHLNSGDFEEWLSLWSEDGVQMMQYVPARVGINQIRSVMRPVFRDYTVELEITDIPDVIVSGDTGLTRCTYTMSLVDRKGDRIPGEPDGKTLTVYARQPDGSWKITYDCSNTSRRRRSIN